MKLSIPRGMIYHSLLNDFMSLLMSSFINLNDKKIIKQFERAFASYMGSQYCVAFPFARVAIYYALKAKKLSPGSEIIMPPITIKAILDVILDLGLKPVFVDINPHTLCFDMDALERAITDSSKAIIITYLYGMVPNIEQMMNICKRRELFVIEDFSQCLNGEFNQRKIGTFADVGVYSASSIKTLDTYGGGLLITDDKEIYQQLIIDQKSLASPDRKFLIKKVITNIIRNLATSRWVFHGLTFPLLKLINRFNENALIKNTGERSKDPLDKLPSSWFSSYTSLQAKVGLNKLSKVKIEDEIRIRNANTFRQNLKISFPKGVQNAKNVYWQTIAYFEAPLEAIKYLRKNRIDSATTSLEKISTLPKYSINAHTPRADMIYSNAIFIPSYPKLKSKDISHISKILKSLSIQKEIDE